MRLFANGAPKRVTNFALALMLVLSTVAASVPFIFSSQANAVASPYSEGFEYGSTDWTNTNIATSGADGITASDGSKFGQAHYNAFTRWGSEYRNTFPVGGYDTQIDMFFDPSWAASNAGQFDFSSAINNQSGTHLRDFIFSFGAVGGGDATWYVNASNNAPGNPTGPDRVALTGPASWYTLKYQFRNVGGILKVTMTITNKTTGVVAGTWTLSQSTDLIATVVGGNRYGWFPTQRFDFDHIAIDNAKLTFVNAPQPTAPQNGGTTIGVDNAVTFGWDAVTDADSYQVRYSQNAYRIPNNDDGELAAGDVAMFAASGTTVTQSSLPGGLIFWQVRAIVDGENGPWSNIWSTTLSTSVATNVTQGVHYTTLESAIAAANVGETIRLDANITLSQMVFINKAITLDGNNKTLTAPYSYTVNGVDNAVLTVTAGNVTVKDLTLTNTASAAKPHGMVVQEVNNVTISGVKFLNGRAGLIVNGSTVNASNITTEGNSWYGVNVDKPNSVLNISGTNVHNDLVEAALYVDNRVVGTVNDVDHKYTKLAVGPSKPDADYYILDQVGPNAPVITNSPITINNSMANAQATWSHNEVDVDHYEYREYMSQAAADADVDGNTASYWIVPHAANDKTQTVGQSWTGEQTLYYRVVAIDAAGNRSAPSQLGTITIDKVAPEAPEISAEVNGVEITGPTNSYYFDQVWNTPAGNPVRYEYKYWNDIAGNPYKENSGAYFADTTDTTLPGEFNQGKGTHHIQVRSFDAAGNPSDWSNDYAIVYAGPTAEITDPADASTFGNDAVVAITGSSEGAKSYVLSIDGVTVQTNSTDFESFSTYSWNSASYVGVTTHTIKLVATDPSGVTNEQEISVTIDNADPTVTIDQPTVTLINDATPTITGTYLDNDANNDTTILLSIDGAAGIAVTKNTDGTWTYTPSVALAEGTHSFVATVSDTVGNSSSSATLELTIDTLSPALTVNQGTAAGNTATITGTAEVNATLSATFNGVTSSVANVNGAWTFTAANLANGTYAFSIIATDAAGNATQGTTTVTVAVVAAGPGQQTTIAPPIISPVAVAENQGVQGATDDNTDNSGVEGVTDVAAIDTDATDGSIFGLAWYWWLLILAALAAITSMIIAAIRRRKEEA